MSKTLIGVGGLTGAGKTDFATKMAVKCMNRMVGQYPDYRFATNISITNVDWPEKIVRYNKLLEISYLVNAVVFIDEVQDQVPNRDWQNTPASIIKFFENHRHSNLRIFLTTQTFRKMDIKIRELIHEAWVVRKIAGTEKVWCLYQKYQLDRRYLTSAPNMEAIPTKRSLLPIPRYGWTAYFRKPLYNTWEDNALIPYKLCLKISSKRKLKMEIRSTQG